MHRRQTPPGHGLRLDAIAADIAGDGDTALKLLSADRLDDITSTPTTASRIDSARNCVRIRPAVAPRARRRPISERRSSTQMIMMSATPTAPTISATPSLMTGNSGSTGLCYLPVTCPGHAASWKPVERGSSGSSPEAQ
jgi:hypothetical protein